MSQAVSRCDAHAVAGLAEERQAASKHQQPWCVLYADAIVGRDRSRHDRHAGPLVSEVQAERADDQVRSMQGNGRFERTIRLPVSARMQPARLALPEARQELLNLD